VRLNLKTDDEVRSAFREITSSVAKAVVGAQIEGVTVQEMIHEPSAVELILGAKKAHLRSRAARRYGRHHG
jgi:acyl-CoA synthetase (NDP forming)